MRKKPKYLARQSLIAAAGAIFALFIIYVASAQQVTNPTQIENSRPGTTDWQINNYASNHEIEGYANLTSVNRGGQIELFVNTAEPTYQLEVFRIGYYGGLAGRRMTQPVTLPGTIQTIPSPDPTTGMVECNWINPYVLTINNPSDPTDWPSGFYLVKLTGGTSGKQSYIIFVVRDDSRSSDLVYQSSVTTWAAYNAWGVSLSIHTTAAPAFPARR